MTLESQVFFYLFYVIVRASIALKLFNTPRIGRFLLSNILDRNIVYKEQFFLSEYFIFKKKKTIKRSIFFSRQNSLRRFIARENNI